jgi:integrase
MKRNNRGMGFVYQPRYRDKQSGGIKTSLTWWISVSHRGKRIRMSSSSDRRTDALKLLRQKLNEIGSGRPVIPGVEKTTFEDLARIIRDDYEANCRRSARLLCKPDGRGGKLGHLRNFFGLNLAVDITSDRITAYVVNRREAGASNATVNRELSALKRAFRLALKAGKVATRPEIDLLQESNRRKGFFERAHYEALLRHLPDHLKPVIMTAFTTGWRISSEILTRKKHHVDLEAGWLRLEPGESKNGEGRTFPLTPELRAVLEQQIERTRAFERATGQIVPWLFHHDSRPIHYFRRSWLTACKAAGIPGRIPHDFRRTAVMRLERAGVSRSAAMAMVGHRTQSIYSRYAIADQVALKEGAD